VLADTVYGSDYKFRRMLEGRGQPYVLVVRSNHHLKFLAEDGLELTDPETLANDLPTDAWVTHAAGEGSKGFRLYDWARISLPWVCDAAFERGLLRGGPACLNSEGRSDKWACASVMPLRGAAGG
jgi:hypothetical protein